MNQPAPKKIERPAGPLADPKPEGAPANPSPSVAAPAPGEGLEVLAMMAPPAKPQRARDPVTKKFLPKGAAAETPAAPDASPARRTDRRRWGDRRFNLPKHSRPGFKAHVFNDVPGRIEEAKERGYTHVMKDSKPIQVVVDRSSGMVGYLMEIPQEFYDQDFADKQAASDEVDRAMLGKADSDGGYRPVIPGTNKPVTQAHVIRGREPG